MKAFLRSRIGLSSVAIFLIGMAWMFHRVLDQGHAPQSHGPTKPAPVVHANPAPSSTPPPALPKPGPLPTGAERSNETPTKESSTNDLAENVAYLDRYYQVASRARGDRDRQGNPVTRRANTGTPYGTGKVTIDDNDDDDVPTAPPVARPRPSSRLQGHSVGRAVARPAERRVVPTPIAAPTIPQPSDAVVGAPASASRRRPRRFNPYGNVIKCELVFTIDSTNEQTPLVGLVMQPVYNNGQLVIPAGAEFHGVARPDRLRDRLFSGDQWVLVFPREHDLPNGRQLSVRGVALDRIEPAATGMTWGLTDGSYGLEGKVIRTLENEEIKRFAATFFSQGALTLQSHGSGRGSRQVVQNTPENAVLQGLSANLEKVASDISAEIAQHGVFIRVPAGHQFYFYPMQLIDPDAADVSSDIAAVQ